MWRVRPTSEPDVSFVVSARNEVEHLGATLPSVDAQRTDRTHEVAVADGGSSDGTVALARERGAEVVSEGGRSIATGRNCGAAADGG